MNCQTHAGDVDAARLSAEGIRLANLHLLHCDVRRVAVVLDVYRFGCDAVDGRCARLNLSGFGRINRGRHLAVFRGHSKIIGLNAVLHLRRCGRQTAGAELWSRRRQFAVTIFSAGITQD